MHHPWWLITPVIATESCGFFLLSYHSLCDRAVGLQGIKTNLCYQSPTFHPISYAYYTYQHRCFMMKMQVFVNVNFSYAIIRSWLADCKKVIWYFCNSSVLLAFISKKITGILMSKDRQTGPYGQWIFYVQGGLKRKTLIKRDSKSRGKKWKNFIVDPVSDGLMLSLFPHSPEECKKDLVKS